MQGGKKPQNWKQTPWVDCLQGTLGWRPDGDIRGVYWTEVNADSKDFSVHAFADVDGDGRWTEYTSTKTNNATQIGDPDVY